MRAVLLLIASVSLFGCGSSHKGSTDLSARPQVPEYSPNTFRADVTRMIEEKRFVEATAFVKSADPKKQAEFDAADYLAVAGYSSFLPGLDGISYERSRDWLFPGTSDVLDDRKWQDTAFEFAKQYNLYRDRK